MPRRSFNDCSSNLTLFNSFEKLTYGFVVRRRLPARVRVLGEREELVRRLDPRAVLGFEGFEVNRQTPAA